MSGLEEFLTPQVTGIAVAGLVMLAVAGVIFSLFAPSLSGTKRRDQRMQAVAARPQTEKQRKLIRDDDRRKKSIQDQLKDFEERQKAKHDRQQKVPLKVKMEQAGLGWEMKHFVIFSIVSCLIFLVIGFLASGNIWITFAAGFAGALGFPRWYVGNKRKRRFNRFLEELPNGVDIIVRGVKAGLPLGDCIKVVARESREPVATEFRKITETQIMGVSLAEAVAKMPERVPLAEANFFAIVVAIQQKAGGGLAEALGNLSKVLRGRKALKGKIKALSSEAKSSAMIIGAMPFGVGGIIFLIAPDYIMMLFNTTAGNIIIAGCLFWMFIGVMVMRHMINFDF
ncbi:MAG: type II secretion system F family protein [Roseibium album]|uniref:Flp pilus assembly protein TadB n=2 Tax=cellular organisms TaxID=131567 RepID=A0A0M7AX49_9HYPH|nr:type II secretion system F family protein [Roseibium album]MBG6145869.1 tight adherence protein B [Labrenzia sp. EL_142]MBG6154716.1 tight adherence protein B [Labrenzia sp. EL_162]MBG6161994.1 tight adherence protein B [Labrenzia sp. EL_195]MBG6176249.1 tight adherence protein B [Labrenzia sp. EL_132]MBG6193154.1 tight adherence protein B [Labrenzia sp. EL_159]MBG6211317.1 tight adherence protein B [Labrenzia sp. EL_126]MBG6231283.1 tight adherence protein B [Labrenzia sp. EL_208]MCR906